MIFTMRQLAVVVFALMLLGNPLRAQTTVVWDGAGDGTTYEDSFNWVGGTPDNDLVTDIARLTGSPVDLSSTVEVGGIDFDSGSTLNGTGSIEIGTSGIDVGGNSTIGTTAVFNQANTNINLFGGSLTLGGPITGSGDLSIIAGGAANPTVVFSGVDNTLNFTGNITVNSGATLAADRNAIRLDTGTHANTTITLDGGELGSSGGDHLELTGRDIVVTANGGTLRHAHARNIFGGFAVTGAGELTIANQVGAPGSTAGRVQLQGANTYTGGTNITNGGQAWVYSDASLGAANTDVRMSDGGTYFAANGVNLGTRAFTIEPGSEAENARIDTNGNTTTIGGAISGTGALDIVGGGTLFIGSAGNTFSGGTRIDGAAVRYGANAGALGTGTVTLDNGGELYGADHMNLSGNASIVLGENGGTIRQRHARNVFGLAGVVISGSGALTLASEGTGSGRIQMEGTNTYTGGTIIEDGTVVRANSNAALGDAAGSLTFSGGILQNNNSNIELGNRAITIDADGGTFIAGWSNRRITSDGEISGVGQLTIANDSSTVRLRGVNTYTGGTNLQGIVWGQTGTLGTGDVTLNNVEGSRGHLKNFEQASTHANNFILDDINGGRLSAGWASDLTITGVVSGAGTLQIEGDSGTVVLAGENTHTGNIDLMDANSALKVTGTLGIGSYAGTISGAGTFEYAGSGTQELTGTSTYTGTTTVSSGTLAVNGDISTSSLTTVNSGATIGGDGTVGDLTIAMGGFHSPGNSPGVMAVNGNYTMSGTLNTEITGTTPGVGGYDQVDVTGVVDISGGLFNPMISAGTYAAGDLFFVVLNDGTDDVIGTFTGLGQGDVATSFGGFDWQVSYAADSVGNVFTGGNDIALQAITAVPEPSSFAVLGLGCLYLAGRRRRR